MLVVWRPSSWPSDCREHGVLHERQRSGIGLLLSRSGWKDNTWPCTTRVSVWLPCMTQGLIAFWALISFITFHFFFFSSESSLRAESSLGHVLKPSCQGYNELKAVVPCLMAVDGSRLRCSGAIWNRGGEMWGRRVGLWQPLTSALYQSRQYDLFFSQKHRHILEHFEERTQHK